MTWRQLFAADNHPCNQLPKGCKPYPGGHLPPPANCDNATGLPWIACDGIHNVAAIDEGDAPRANDMMGAVQQLSVAAYFCNSTAHACQFFTDRAALLLRVWFLNQETAMLPNLFFGQIQPSKTLPHPGHGGFIEWTAIAPMLDAVTLLAATDEAQISWTAQDRAGFKRWIQDFEVYVSGSAARGERDMTNNHGSWFDVDWMGVAGFAGNKTTAIVAAEEVKTRRVAMQITANGTQWIEVERTNSVSYCIYNLVALTRAADMAASFGAGVDVWSYVAPTSTGGGSLRAALDFMIPYVRDNKTWPYPQMRAPDYVDLIEPFRRASRAYRNRTYEQILCTLQTPERRAGVCNTHLDLLNPPLFKMTAQCKTDDSATTHDDERELKTDGGGCKDEADCGYNGACQHGVCVCSPPWTGSECQRLDLKDVRPATGLREASTSTWGGSVVHGDDGRLYMYASEMVAHCGIESWTRNSRVIVASADNISAPFRFEREVFGVFSHEPAAVRAPTGEYVLFFTTTTFGCGSYGACVPNSTCPGIGNGSSCNPGGATCWTQCHGGSTAKQCFPSKVEESPLTRYPTYMSWSHNPLGPFSTPVMVYNGTDRSQGASGTGASADATGDTNLACVILPDHSLVGIWKGDRKGGNRWSLASFLLSMSASDWRQPLTYRFGRAEKSNSIFPQLVGNENRTCEIEDPTLWYNATDGVVHAVVHNWNGGGHAASCDRGRSWRWYGGNCSAAEGSKSLDWSRSVWPSSFQFLGDDARQTPRRRERPHILLGKDGVVTGLITAVQLEQHDATWTLVQEANHEERGIRY